MKTIYKYGPEILMASVMVVLWVAGALLFEYAVPQYSIGWVFHLTAGLFLLLTFVAAVLTAGWEHGVKDGRIQREDITGRYMIWKGVKAGICIAVFALIFWLVRDMDTKVFVFVFFIFYLVSLTMESTVFLSLQKRIDRGAELNKTADKAE